MQCEVDSQIGFEVCVLDEHIYIYIYTHKYSIEMFLITQLMFLLYNFNVVLFLHLYGFPIGGYQGIFFWHYLKTFEDIFFQPLVFYVIVCYKTSCIIVCVGNNLYGWIEQNTCFIFTFGMYGSFSYKCVVDINVLFKCKELIM